MTDPLTGANLDYSFEYKPMDDEPVPVWFWWFAVIVLVAVTIANAWPK